VGLELHILSRTDLSDAAFFQYIVPLAIRSRGSVSQAQRITLIALHLVHLLALSWHFPIFADSAKGKMPRTRALNQFDSEHDARIFQFVQLETLALQHKNALKTVTGNLKLHQWFETFQLFIDNGLDHPSGQRCILRCQLVGEIVHG
jgi:hypothetical protein